VIIKGSITPLTLPCKIFASKNSHSQELSEANRYIPYTRFSRSTHVSIIWFFYWATLVWYLSIPQSRSTEPWMVAWCCYNNVASFAGGQPSVVSDEFCVQQWMMTCASAHRTLVETINAVLPVTLPNV